MTFFSRIILICALLPCFSSRLAAEEWYDNNFTNAWLANYDPTLIGRRLKSEFSYQDLSGGRSTYKIDNTFRGAYPLAKDIAFGYQLEQPYQWSETGADSVSGTGDFELRMGVVRKFSSTLRGGLAVNSEFDTASDSTLGANALLLRPILGIRWDANDRLNLGLNVEYTFTPTDEGANDTSQLELKIPVAYKISEQWSTELTYKPQWDFLGGSSRQRLELDLGYVFGSRHQFALSGGVEVPLTNQDLQFKSLSSLTWYF